MKKSFRITALFSIVILFLLYFYSFSTTDSSNLSLSVENEISSGWEISGLENGEEFPLTSVETTNYDKTILLRRVVPEDWNTYNSIRVDGFRAVSVFVDGTLVYSNNVSELSHPGELPLMQMPQDQPFFLEFSYMPSWAGKDLTVVTRTYENQPHASIAFDLISDEVTLYQHEAWVNKNALPGAMFGLLSLLFLGVAIFQVTTIGKGYPILLLAFSSLLQMLAYMGQLNENPFPFLDLSLATALFYLFPLLYLQTKMSTSRKKFLIITLLVWSLYFFVYLNTFVFYLPVPYWFDKIDALTLILLVVMLYYCFKERRENWYIRKFLTLLGMFSIGYVILFIITSIVNKQLNEFMIILFKEAFNLYCRPLMFWVFTTILFSLFILVIWDIVREKINSEKQMAQLQSEQAILNMQMAAAGDQLQALRSSQEQTIIYRHDMRHHLSMIYNFVAQNDIDKINNYLHEVNADIDAITPIRYCKNETVNLLLSAFDSKAKNKGITLQIDVKIPVILGIEDTELCTLISNSIENAMNAVENLKDESLRKIEIYLNVKNNKLLISTRNAYEGELEMDGKLFKSKRKESGHGYGVKSIISIVDRYTGLYSFNYDDGIFILSIMIPINTNQKNYVDA